jgi:ADP-ribosylglycohydrolase
LDCRGAFAQIIADVVHGESIRTAVDAILDRCRAVEGGGEVVESLGAALALVNEGKVPTPQRVELLGGGWVAEEALAISVYCALSATSPADAVANAVNHGGDSDSTGSITGNILGAALGVDWLDAELLGELEGRSVIEQLADNLYDTFIQPPDVRID